ncbi:MAG: dihydrolipoyllysine-residue acetyltransferase [Woeseia sp.]
MSDSKDITVPDLGDFSDVEVIEVLVGAGDTVARENGLITLETDKATMDIPSPEDGVIDEITVKTGDRVSSGDTIGRMRAGESGDSDDGAGDKEDDEAGERSEKDSVADEAGDTSGGDSDSDADDADSSDGDAGKKEKPASKDDDADTKPPAKSSGQGGEQSVKVPDIGDFDDVDVIEVLVREGDTVAVDDPLITLETDKAAMDVPSTVAGTIKSLKVKAGDKVSEGSEIAIVAADAEAPADSDKKTSDSKQESPPETPEKERKAEKSGSRESSQKAATATDGKLPPIDESGFSKAHASPSVRKLARELGVDLARVKGSGPKDRVLHDDVKKFVKSIIEGGGASGGVALPKVPSVDFARFGDIDSQPLTRIQKISGPRLQASWVNLPHVTQHDLADITELEERRQKLKGPAKEQGISLTPLAFVMKACISALREFPKVNASLSGDGESLVYKQYYHLGFAADTENGLVVPVIRDADKMDIYEIASQLGELSEKARDGKLKADQMQGASFTISSLGGIGGTAFTPIINAPEVAILGVSRSSMQPVWDGSDFKPRLMLPLSFSYDHRVIDGAYAVRFTTHLAGQLADVDSLVEAIP